MTDENTLLQRHIERESRKRNVCQVTMNGAKLDFKDSDGDRLEVTVFSNGQTAIAVRDNAMNDMTCLLSNRAAHELRDFLNARFPNATAVQ